MKNIMGIIYCLPLYDVGFIGTVLVVGFGIFGSWFCKNGKKTSIIWKRLNVTLFAIQLFLLFYLNLHDAIQESPSLNLRLFHTLRDAAVQTEMYRVMIMKGALYIPFGMTFSFLCKEKETTLKCIIKTIIAGLAWNTILEAAQFFLKCGNADIDSIIFGVLGCGVGCLSLVAFRFCIMLQNKDDSQGIENFKKILVKYETLIRFSIIIFLFLLLLIQVQAMAVSDTAMSVFQNVGLVAFNIGLMVVPIIFLCIFVSNEIGVLVGIVIFYFAWSIINYFVMLYHGSPLLISELQNIKTALSLIQGYSLKLDFIVGIRCMARFLIVLMLLCILYFLEKNSCRTKKNTRKIWGIILLLDLGFIFGSTYGDGIIKPRSTVGWSWEYAISEYGFFSCVFEDIQNMIDPYVKPDSYDSKILVDVDSEPPRIEDEYPDIILILNESFCDLSIYTDIQADQEYLSNFYDNENAIYGHAIVPEIGMTNNSEYELLTSNSMYLLRSNAPFNYVDLSGHNVVRYLKEFNYDTWGMHCGLETNYSRNTAYPELGFDKILLGADAFKKGLYGNRAWLDYDNYQDLIAQYESGGEAPRFLYMLTLQNHGSFEKNKSKWDTVHTKNDYEDLTDDVNEFLTSIALSADAFQTLTDYFAEVEREVIICMVGDHAPSFIIELPNSYNLSEDNKQIALRTVPYVIWSNFETEISDFSEYASITDLVPMILHTAGIPLDTYYQKILDLHNQVPVRTSSGIYMDKSEAAGAYAENSPYYSEITEYYCMEYHILTGK